MRSKVIRVVVLVLIFLGTMFTSSFIMNRGNKDITEAMAETSLPVMNFIYNDHSINEVHGYIKQMDAGYIRDVITPIGDDKTIRMEIMTYGNDIKTIGYEVRSMDGEYLLVDSNDTEFVRKGDKIICEITLNELLETNVEYSMAIWLTNGDQKIYYYTRLICEEDCYLDESIDFALQFHEYTFREDAAEFIPTYMDPATGDATTLSYVDLSCTLRQITWADFTGVRLTEPVASVEEVTSSYNVITVSYVITNVNEQNEVEYYNVEEYYRLRQAATRMYVLNFERRMNQIFRVENSFIQNNSSILLGIRDANVEFKSNDAGDSIAFVQEGELWSYNRVNNVISQVFSFRGLEGIDTRENWNQHEIEIIRVDEAGSVDFVVYGYMNRGDHEGEVGIGVYHYDAIANTVEEELFISTNKSYETLKAELGELMYVNEQKLMYFLMNEKLYKVDLTTYKITVELENMKTGNYAVSESNRYFAWVENEQKYSSSAIQLIDLKMGIIYDVTDEEGTYLWPLDFLGEDFIYGIAKAENVKVDTVGNMVFPMSTLKIMNTLEEDKAIIKTYQPFNGYVEKIKVVDQNIYVTFVEEQDGRYWYSGEDIIMNRELETASEVTVDKIVTEAKQTQVILTMKAITSTNRLEAISSSHILTTEEFESVALENADVPMYYVYSKGEAVLATSNLSEAIVVANDNLGVVVDENRQYLWKRAKSTTRSPFKNLMYNDADANAGSVAKCVSVMLMREGKGFSVNEPINAGLSPQEILSGSLTDAYVTELYGCTSDEIMYFVDQGTPVFAYVGPNEAVLVVGYSSTLVHYYNPQLNAIQSVEISAADDLFKQGGNHFVVYLK